MIGLMGAGVLLVIFTIIVIVSIMKAPASTKSNQDLFGADPSEIPDVTETQTGGAMLVTMVDKNDPTRVAATLKATRFEPIGEGRRRLDDPVSWIYLKDGGAIEVTADFATMLMPDPNEPPESGTLEGNIQIRAYDSADDLSKPSLVASFDEPVEFERRYLRLRSAGQFDISSEQFDFSGADLTIILNELRDRVELIEVVHGDQIVIYPGKGKDSKSKPILGGTTNRKKNDQHAQKRSTQNTDRSEARSEANETQTAQGAADEQRLNGIDRYHLTMSDQVVARVMSSPMDGGGIEVVGQVASDRLELWALVVDGALPDDAVAPIRFASRPKEELAKEPANGRKKQSTKNVKDAQPKASAKPEESTSGHIVITWEGKLVLRPMPDDQVGELGDDALAFELGTDSDGGDEAGVRFEASKQGFVGQAHRVRYWASRGMVQLESVETPGGIVKLEAEGAGELLATTLDADLTSGELMLSGRGSMRADQGEDVATILWHKNAKIMFDTDDLGVSDRLLSAAFEGGVVAKQFDPNLGDSSGHRLGAMSLEASFDPSKPASVSLEHLSMTKGVLNSAARSMLTGTTVDVSFSVADDGVNGSSLMVDRLVADGQVFARDSGSLLRTEHLEVDMMRRLDGRGDGQAVISRAVAEGSVEFRGKDLTSADAQKMTLLGLDDRITLVGSPARVGQGESNVLGEIITLNGNQRTIEVDGAGSFDHEIVMENQDDEAGESDIGHANVGHIKVTWKGSMRFDDAIGKIVCEDDVRVVSTPDAYTRDTLWADRAQIKLSARPSDDPIDEQAIGNDSDGQASGGIGGDPWAGGFGDGGRVLEWARFYGHAPIGQDPEPVKIESRKYAVDDPSLVVGLMYLEGAQVLADNLKETLEVPSAGVLLVLDRSSEVEDAPDQGSSDTDSGAMGDGLTRFAWEGSMQLDRVGGNVEMYDSVVVRHKALSTGLITQLSSDELNARFALGDSGVDADASQEMRLVAIDANGQVRFVYEGRELISDIARYDAITDSVFASGEENRLVTLYDDTQPAPMSAKTMRWNLGRDQIEINAISPVRGVND